jgi:hypothetical protein
LSNTSRSCFTRCEFFRCEQRAVVLRGQTAYCRFADDECTPSGCKYTRCVKGRLLPNGVCSLTIKARELEAGPEEFVDPMEIPDNLIRRVKLRRTY